MGATEYTHLVFARERYWQVSYGEQSYRSTKSDSTAALNEHFDATVRPALEAAAAERASKWDTDRRSFGDATSVVKVDKKVGSMGSRIKTQVAVVTLPDGKTVECDPSSVDSTITQACVDRHGPRPEVARATLYSQWLNETRAAATEIRGWTGTAYMPDGSSQAIQSDLGAWEFGAPIAGVTKVLNEYSGAGWTVISVAEDKGLYSGTDARDESFPTRIRYLLARSRGS